VQVDEVPWTWQVPKNFEIQVVHELGVLPDGLFGHRVDNTIAHFFDINYLVKVIGRLVKGWGMVYAGGAVNARLMTW
jgi:hypothetical protein